MSGVHPHLLQMRTTFLCLTWPIYFRPELFLCWSPMKSIHYAIIDQVQRSLFRQPPVGKHEMDDNTTQWTLCCKGYAYEYDDQQIEQEKFEFE